MPKIIDKTLIETWYRALQDDICRQLAAEDGEEDFLTDDWQREEGGGGRTRILQGGKVFDKPARPMLRLGPIHGRSLASRLWFSGPRRELSWCCFAEARVKQLYSKSKVDTMRIVLAAKAFLSV